MSTPPGDYRTFKRTCTDWKSFARARKIEDMRNLSYEDARNRCQYLNKQLTARQVKAGTKFEFERQ